MGLMRGLWDKLCTEVALNLDFGVPKETLLSWVDCYYAGPNKFAVQQFNDVEELAELLDPLDIGIEAWEQPWEILYHATEG